MGYDKIRDKMFDIVEDYNLNFTVYQQLIREGIPHVIKMTEKKLDKFTKQLDKLLTKIPPTYPYKNDLEEMIKNLKREREDFELIFK